MPRVLIADDQEEARYLLETLLGGNGFEVLTASNGAVAWEQARAAPPDLVISDILMPVMDGFTLCRLWKKDPELRHVPFVFYTATYTDSKDEQFALGLGADRFMVKPMEPEAFLSQIREVLAQYRAGTLQPSAGPFAEESVQLQKYNEVLIHKLEHKLEQLEEANLALKAEKAFNQAVLNSLSAHVAVVDATGKIIAVNEAWSRYAQEGRGREIDRVGIGANYLDACRAVSETACPEAQAARQGIARVLTGDSSSFELEYACHGPHEEHWFLMRVTPLGVPEGGAAIAHIDISERKRAEKARAEQLNLLETLLEASPAPIYYKDLKGRYLGCNKAYADLIGSSRENLIGKSVPDLRPKAFADICTAMDRKLLDNPGVQIYEPKFPDAEGNERSLIFNKATFNDAQGNLAGIVGVLLDITALRSTERQLERVQRELELILESVWEAILGIDADGKVMFANPAAARVLGYAIPEMLGQVLHSIWRQSGLDGQPGDRKECELGRTVIAGQPYHSKDEQFFRKDGSHFAAEVITNPILDRGRITGAVVSFWDITEHVEMERQFLQAQKMEAVGRLAGGIAHDFNNMLAVILGYAELMMQKLDPQGPLHRNADAVHKAAERAAALTLQLLAFSRKQIVQPEVININTVIKEIEKMLARLLGEDIEQIVFLGSDVGNIRADRSQIQQIIMNLAVNARDAMPSGGKLVLETDNVLLDPGDLARHPDVLPGSYVMLRVSDNGVGMDEATQTCIFEPFFTTKDPGKGTGLGLSTVYGIVRQSGGQVTVHSEPGQGTTFTVYLPCVSEPPTAVEKEGVGSETGKGSETILLVEDDEMLRKLLCESLRVSGYQVIEARNGREALASRELERGPLHLLLTDVVMPLMGGPELARMLLPAHPRMKILYMSGYTDDAIIHHGVLDRTVHLVEKPFAPRELLQRVRRILDQPDSVSPDRPPPH